MDPAPDNGLSLDRIVVVGTSGAGKSTLARALAARLRSPYVELDELFWGPRWTPKPPDAFTSLVRERTAGERWIVDGNYASVRELTWPRATAVLWLDYPLAVVLVRVLRRTAARALAREPLWHGNRESLARALFTRDSIVWWTLTTHWARRADYTALRANRRYPGLAWCVLRRPSDATHLLAGITPR